MDRKIQYQNKNNHSIVVREANGIDAPGIINLAKDLFDSTDFVTTTPQEYRPNKIDYINWVNSYKQKENSLLLVAEYDHRIIGQLNFDGRQKLKEMHIGELGIGIHPDFQNCGVGRILIEELLNWASQNKIIEKIVLSVFESNRRAIHLYKSAGFMKEGRNIRAIKQSDGTYVDTIQMCKFVKPIPELTVKM